MSRRIRTGIVIALVSALGVFAAGCGGDDETAAPAGSTPAATTAPVETTTAPVETTTAPAAQGDVAAGKTFFEATCQGCHTEGGTVAGAGPVLAQKGLTAEGIKSQIENPRDKMPKGLASGADLDNVVAFVASIQ